MTNGVNRDENNTVYRFRTLFKDLPLKYQNVTYPRAGGAKRRARVLTPHG
jgi:hypothetical protein